MSVARKILTLLVQIFFCAIAFAQRERIDSLKKVLPSLRDSAKVDCLNALSEIYLKFNYRDTAANFANQAYEEAFKFNYIHGIAESLSYKGEIEFFPQHFRVAEKLSREAIEWYRNTSKKNRLAETYYNLGSSLYAQSFFEEAIRNLDTAYEWHKKNSNTSGMFWALSISDAVYHESGNYEKSFEFARKSLDIAIQNKNDQFRRVTLTRIAWLFQDIEDYKTEFEYYRQAFGNLKPRTIVDSLGEASLLRFAKLFALQRQYDSAKYYYSLTDTLDQRGLRFYLTGIGEYYLLRKQYNNALPNLNRALNYHRQSNDRNQVMHVLMDLANTYLALGINDSAFKYGNESLNIAKQTSAKQFIRDASEILSSIYDRWQQPDSAYYYYKQYTTTKDSVMNNVIKGKLAAYTFEQKMELLNKEKQIQKVQLQKQSLVKNILISGVVVLMLLGIIIFRNIILKRKSEAHRRELAENELQFQRLESERTRAELEHQASELEMQALRAQMNPHFIFNSLNSINRFILQNNRAQASEYLTKFSKLVRMILQNSQTSLISLENELEALGLYLEMEALRFNYHFNYKISVPKDLDIEVLKVPPLIIQPYVENAIWHGLMHKEEKGQLDVEVSQKNDFLFFKITDDGIGRKKAAELASKSATKHKSMGLRITADRIAMLQSSNGNESPVIINDLVNADGSAAGTEVIIKMPVIDKTM